jgi:hypothetical protein
LSLHVKKNYGLKDSSSPPSEGFRWLLTFPQL